MNLDIAKLSLLTGMAAIAASHVGWYGMTGLLGMFSVGFLLASLPEAERD